MNVLALVSAFCYEVNLPAPTTLIGTITSPADLQILNLLYSVSRDLRQDRPWPQQKAFHTFTCQAGRTKYPLPQNFYAASLGTQYDTGRRWELSGPISDTEFAYRTYGIYTSQNRIAYRIFGPDSNPNTAGGQFNISPAPVGGEILTYEYLTSNLFFPKNWEPSESGITTISFRNANGNIYDCSAITTGITGTTPPSHTSGGAVDGGVTWQFLSTPYETITANSDISLWDDDIIILGLIARWYQMKGLDHASIASEYASKFDSAKNRFNGSFRGSFSRVGSNVGRYTPSTVGGWAL